MCLVAFQLRYYQVSKSEVCLVSYKKTREAFGRVVRICLDTSAVQFVIMYVSTPVFLCQDKMVLSQNCVSRLSFRIRDHLFISIGCASESLVDLSCHDISFFYHITNSFAVL